MLNIPAKVCPRCRQVIPRSAYERRIRRGREGIQSYCPRCNSERGREHYKQNKAKYKEKAATRRIETRQDYFDRQLAYLEDHPCVDCGEDDPIVLQFDHVRGEKVMGISLMISGQWSWERIEDEIAKCDVRCANCHTRRTATQLGWRKAQ